MRKTNIIQGFLLFRRLHASIPGQHTDALPSDGVPSSNGEDCIYLIRTCTSADHFSERRDVTPTRSAVVRQMVGVCVAVKMGVARDIATRTQ